MTTTTLNWTEQGAWLGGGRWVEVNGYKITQSRTLKSFIVEPLREDGLPFLADVPAKGWADTLEDALMLTERPCCHGCGRVTAAHVWPIADGYECRDATR